MEPGNWMSSKPNVARTSTLLPGDAPPSDEVPNRYHALSTSPPHLGPAMDIIFCHFRLPKCHSCSGAQDSVEEFMKTMQWLVKQSRRKGGVYLGAGQCRFKVDTASIDMRTDEPYIFHTQTIRKTKLITAFFLRLQQPQTECKHGDSLVASLIITSAVVVFAIASTNCTTVIITVVAAVIVPAAATVAIVIIAVTSTSASPVIVTRVTAIIRARVIRTFTWAPSQCEAMKNTLGTYGRRASVARSISLGWEFWHDLCEPVRQLANSAQSSGR